jgi:signal transduction histidine kinase
MGTAAGLRAGIVAGIGGAGLLAGVVLETIDSKWSAVDALWMAFAVVPLYAVGLFVTQRRPAHPQAHRLLVAGSSFATGSGLESWASHLYRDAVPGPRFWLLNLASDYTNVIGIVAISSLIALFPFGDAEQPWIRRTVRALWLELAIPPLLIVTNDHLVVSDWFSVPVVHLDSPLTISWLTWLGPGVTWFSRSFLIAYVGPVLLLWRYRAARGDERVLMRGLIGVVFLSITLLLLVAGVAELGGGPTAATDFVIGFVSIFAILMLTVCFVVGILRYQLFDIDVVLHRSAVFITLWCAIAGIYVVVAAAPGLVLGGRLSVPVAVLLTIVVAVAFQPVRRWLEAVADRRVFGTRINRYELIRAFGATLEMNIGLDELLPRLAITVRDGLGAPWVRVALTGDEGQGSLVGAQSTAGVPAGDADLTQVLRGGDIDVGRIECGPKPGGYTDGDRELLEALAGQAAPAISNVRLAAQLADRLVELERSRSRIFNAQELERRRIERDLHDGAQQEVVAILAKVSLARNQLDRGEGPAAVLGELHDDVLELLADLRELAHGIHPPVLSDRGLVAAIEARADRLTVPVTVRADESLRGQRLGDDVEGAAYSIVCEALTNVVKHSGAATSDVALASVNDLLCIEVRDDGAGFSSANGSGTGLANIRDRVEALGGRLRIDGKAMPGTRLSVELPVPALGAT